MERFISPTCGCAGGEAASPAPLPRRAAVLPLRGGLHPGRSCSPATSRTRSCCLLPRGRAVRVHERARGLRGALVEAMVMRVPITGLRHDRGGGYAGECRSAVLPEALPRCGGGASPDQRRAPARGSAGRQDERLQAFTPQSVEGRLRSHCSPCDRSGVGDLAFVVQRYGRQTPAARRPWPARWPAALGRARRHGVQTCARDYVTWRNECPRDVRGGPGHRAALRGGGGARSRASIATRNPSTGAAHDEDERSGCGGRVRTSALGARWVRSRSGSRRWSSSPPVLPDL